MQRTLVLILSVAVLAASTSLRGRTQSQRDPHISDEYEYGDRETALSQGDSSDFSLHQFFTDDDGRKGTPTSNDGSGDAEMTKSAALAADDHFDSEDDSDAFVKTVKNKFETRATTANRLKQDPSMGSAESLDSLPRHLPADAFYHADSFDSLPRHLPANAFEHDHILAGEEISDNSEVGEEKSGNEDPSMGPSDSFDSLPRHLPADAFEHDRILAGEEISDNSEVGEEKSGNEEGMHEDSNSLLQNQKDTLRATEIAAILLKQDPKSDDEPRTSNSETAEAIGDSSVSSLGQLLVSDDIGDSDSVGREGSAEDSEDINPGAEAGEEQSNQEDTPDDSDSFAQTHARVMGARANLK